MRSQWFCRRATDLPSIESARQPTLYLQNLGVGLEVSVGICIERSLEMVVGVLGILKAGGAYIPLERKLSPRSPQFHAGRFSGVHFINPAVVP